MKIEKINYLGHDAVRLATKAFELVAIYSFGPRIAFLGKSGGENALFWDKEKLGRGDWLLRGGHRVWIGRANADESEETYAADNDKADVVVQENSFTLTGATDKRTGTRRGFTVRAISETLVEVDNFVTNESDMLFSGFVWPLTCSLPGKETVYRIPLGDGTSWDSFQMVYFRTWAGHGQVGFDDDQFKIGNEFLEIRPKGLENKRMIQSHRGIFLMEDAGRDFLFAKRCGLERGAAHPMGCNLAAYIGPKNFMLEMESMGAEKPLKTGESLHWKEEWAFHPKHRAVKNVSELEGLFK